MRVTTVIFDYGGVLSTPQPPESRARMEALAGGAGAAIWPPYWELRAAYDRDDLSSLEYWRQVGERCGVTFDTGQVERLVDADHQSWSHLNEPMVAWATGLKAAGVRVGLLSNAPRDFAAHARQAFAWSAEFDWLTFSGEVGAIKPHPAIYRHCLDGLGVPPGGALFIDDRPENVEAASAIGLTALHFETVETLAADLAAVDGLPPLGAATR